MPTKATQDDTLIIDNPETASEENTEITFNFDSGEENTSSELSEAQDSQEEDFSLSFDSDDETETLWDSQEDEALWDFSFDDVILEDDTTIEITQEEEHLEKKEVLLEKVLEVPAQGDMNSILDATISSLEGRKSEIAERVKKKEETKAALEEKIRGLEGEKAELEWEIADLNNESDKITSSMNDIWGMKLSPAKASTKWAKK